MLYLLYIFRLFDDSYQKPGGFALLLHSGNKKTRKIDSFHVLFSMLNINFIGFKTSSFLKKHAEFHSIILQVVWNLLSLGFCFCKSALVKMIKYLQLLNTNLSSIYSFYNYGKHHFMSFI